MDKWIMCVVALILGMLLANMLKSVCGCKNVVEGAEDDDYDKCNKCMKEWGGNSHVASICSGDCPCSKFYSQAVCADRKSKS